MLTEIMPEELSAALDGVAMKVLREAGVEKPPVDVISVAGRLGITVAWDDRQDARGRYVRLRGVANRPPRPTILLRLEPRQERSHWTVAHEIGEHSAHRVFAALGLDTRELATDAREKVANYLAGRLLAPTAWFAADGADCGWDLLALKERFSTASHELLARRMLDLPPRIIITIFDQGRLYFRRWNLPGRAPGPNSTELECQRTAHERNRPHQRLDVTPGVRAWPVHEEGWRREILRTGVEWEME